MSVRVRIRVRVRVRVWFILGVSVNIRIHIGFSFRCGLVFFRLRVFFLFFCLFVFRFAAEAGMESSLQGTSHSTSSPLAQNKTG